MGRASRADAAKHRQEVVDAMARLLRERGSAGASVQDVMSTVGLTHGGFYKHFKSKDELMGIAATAAFSELQTRLIEIIESFPERSQARSELLRDYLSTEHRDDPGAGCASAALAGDSARVEATSSLRKSYVEGVESAFAVMAEFEDAPGRGHEEAYRRAVVDFATMVGALTLARATDQTALSENILQVVREALDAQQ